MRGEEDVLDDARVPLFDCSLPRGLVLGQEGRAWPCPAQAEAWPGPALALSTLAPSTLSRDWPQASGPLATGSL